MSATLEAGRSTLHIDVVMWKNDERWVAECLPLGLVAAGPEPEQVFRDAQKICAAQVIYAMENDLLGSLIRPPDAESLLRLFHARKAGKFDMTIQATLAGEPLEQPIEFQRAEANAA